MAARRSRLQIKPNILGGPKGPSVKPTPKAPSKATNIDESSSAKSDSSSTVQSPTKVTSPKKNPTLKEAVKHVKEVEVEDKKNIDQDEHETKTGHEDNVGQKSNNTAQEPFVDKPEKAPPPARARIRKFGKVNITAARGLKSDPAKPADEKKPQADTLEKTQTQKTELQKTETVESKKDETEVVKDSSEVETGSKTQPNATVISRRSRFPKAKPNIADAGRRKQKEATAPEEIIRKSSVPESPKKIPEITITDTSVSNDVPKTPISKPEISLPPESPHALTKIQPRLSATPVPVQKSPLKNLTPTIPVSPEKRVRTFSTSEAPVVKRQRKVKVDAPTDKPPDRSTMKMRDLIRWNPTNNPMKPKIKKTEAGNAPGVEKENILDEEKVQEKEECVVSEPDDTPMPVPQITIGPDGNIVINEKSLIVKEPEKEKVSSQEEIIDETDMITHYNSFRTRNLSKRWTKKDTKKFYKALAMIGIDFFMISQLFPNRTRLDIKKKFQKEEKVNRALVEKVLKERIIFDPTVFDKQDKTEESSDDEEEENPKPKGKKGGRRKTNNTLKKENEPKGEKKLVSKKPVKRKKMPLNYFEDGTTDEEMEEPNYSKSQDGPWQPPSVSQKDGEVVGILMDMSEGRIRDEGHIKSEGQGSVMNVMDVNGESPEKFVAVPVGMAKNRPGFIPLEPNSVSASTSVQLSHGGYKSANNQTVQDVPTIPGIQSISLLETQPMLRNAESADSLGIPQQGPSSNSSGQIILPIFNTGASESGTSLQQNVNLYNSQVQYNQTTSHNNSVLLEPGTSASHLQPGTSQLQMDTETIQNQLNLGTIQGQLPQFNPEAVDSSQVTSELSDQYVLVTLMPEGGGETVIHIYRLHGGGQQQNQVLYADPFASQQMTLENMNSSNSTIPIETSNAMPTNEIAENLTQSENVLVNNPNNLTQSSQPFKMEEKSLNCNSQESVNENQTLESSPLDIQNILTSDNELKQKHEFLATVYNDNSVTNDVDSASNFTQLIPHESTVMKEVKEDLGETTTDISKVDSLLHKEPVESQAESDCEVENC